MTFTLEAICKACGDTVARAKGLKASEREWLADEHERRALTAEVIGLGFTDNNRCRLRLEDGREIDHVAEWCTPVEETA